ncbi:MAG: GNAT family N-acetyltransferase [Propionibacteriaceae bacterium]|jgi:ribosomal-protein-alanine N-acetyltransferase|nr:GNAT family N-acetyltransferase [Propionibacteriaceae bacterium]
MTWTLCGGLEVTAPAFPVSHHWPVRLSCGSIILEPFHPRWSAQVNALRARNAAWLTPWDATWPHVTEPIPTNRRLKQMWSDAREGLMAPWLIRRRRSMTTTPELIGQVTLSNIVYGSAMTASLGYWLDQDQAGQSIMPAAVALVVDYAIASIGLHRVEICIVPENQPSHRVVDKLGFRYEGRRLGFLHIAGSWRDHDVFALTAPEMPQGLIGRVARSVYFPGDSGAIAVE